MGLNQNTWKINQWYDQNVAGNVSYSGAKQLWTWGSGNSGILGQNNQTDYSSPVQIPGATWTTPIVGGCGGNSARIQAAIKTDGTLWSWGYGEKGGVGVNDKVYRSSPVQVPGTTWAGGAIGNGCQYHVKTDGTLWSWGDGIGGRLLLNSPGIKYSSPVQVGTDTTWTGAVGKIAAGSNGTVSLIKTDGTLWVGGKNDEGGEVGDGSTTSRSSPVQIPGTWTRVARGSNHGMALNSDGELYVWGYNYSGNLGLNNRTNYSGPQQVGSDTTWTDISCTASTSFATKTDGTLWAWGGGQYGQLGLNQPHSSYISSPTQIPGTTWSKLARGGLTNMGAIKTDGTLWAWGQDELGNLNNNDGDIDRSSPVQMGSDTTWHQVSGTNNGFFAIKEL